MSGIIINQKLPKNSRPWWHISKKLPRNPFDPLERTQYLEWCRVCEMDVSVNVEAANAGTDSDRCDVYRKRCSRCGGTMQWGMRSKDLTGKSPLPSKAFKFIQETGQDRR